MKNSITNSRFKYLLLTGLIFFILAIGEISQGNAAERFFFLSEEGGCSALKSFLEGSTVGNSANSTLIIDQTCNQLTEPLVIPPRFTLAGVGINGEGALFWPNLSPGTPAISIDTSSATVPPKTKNEQCSAPVAESYVTIRDLSIAGSHTGTGIDVSNASFVFMERVRLTDFQMGLFGRDAFSVYINHSNISLNDYNIVMGDCTTNWRIRDSIVKQASFWGVRLSAKSNDHVLVGNRIEDNSMGAILNGSYGAMILNNRFEGNGSTNPINPGVAIWNVTPAMETRIVMNLFSSDRTHDSGKNSQCSLNIGLNQEC